MGWLIVCTILYIAVIAAMCWSSAQIGKENFKDKNYKDFIEKRTNKYKD